MRARSSLFPILCSLLLSSCATTPVAAPAPDLSGSWYGTTQDRGLPLSILLHVKRSADGQYSGTADSPNQVAFDLPIRKLGLEGEQFKAVIDKDGDDVTFAGTVDPAGQKIEGQLKLRDRSPGLVLQRTDPATLNLPRPRSLFYDIDGHHIHYVQMDGPTDLRVVFVHGTPGSWDGWARYLGDADLQRHATLIAVDRPGFGESEGAVVPDMREQARLLAPLLRGPGPADPAIKPAAVRTIVVGHSLGGPIAGELAMDFPDQVQGALLIAPSIDPATEGPRWYNQAMTWWAVSALVSRFMDPELAAANQELMPLAGQLKTMEPRWKQLPMPVTVIQGEKDDLVDPRTADFAQRVLPQGSRIIRVPDEGHFVLWEQPQIELQALSGLFDTGAVAGMPTGSAAR